jgi:hypothetical protein
MTDKNIDSDETRIYGPHTAKRIRSRLLGRIAEFDAALNYIADDIDAKTDAVTAAVAAARDIDADRTQNAQSKEPLLKDAFQLLGRFSTHLDAQEPGSVIRKVYFTRDGTAKGVGRSAQDVLLAITHISTKLADAQCPVRDAAHWHDQFDTLVKTLAPAIASADDARDDRQSLTPEVEAKRQAWLQGYIAAKCIVEGVLRLLGRIDEMPIFFYDLRVPAGTKVTEIPPDEGENAPPKP